ncbi:MAG: peptidoglycan-binding domain-containing protein [Bacteroidota bacterium]
MKTLRLDDEGQSVLVLQKLLKKAGLTPSDHGKVDAATDEAIKSFQQKESLGVDGIAGPNTWKRLLTKHYSFGLGAKNQFLESNEFMSEIFEKNTIYIHHTAGSGKADGVIQWWEKDNETYGVDRYRVGTAFVIGRTLLGGSEKYDGKTWRAFKEYYWCNHLGLGKRHTGKGKTHNKMLEKQSIGIEICSYGHLTKEGSKFYFIIKDSSGKIVVKREIPADQVCTLDKPWRGHSHFHKYTEKQIAETKRIILLLSYLFDINIPDTSYDASWFDIKQDALDGKPGLWTHCNVRPDKTDCFPQPELIEMLNGLHEAAKSYAPTDQELETLRTRGLGPGFPSSKLTAEDELIYSMSDLEDAREERNNS